MTGFAPTEEQEEAAGAFTAGINLAIEAGAGTGKTSTLELIARSTPRIGTYVAFNNAIVRDAERRMPMTCAAATIHAVARRAVGRPYRHRLDANRIPSWQLARMMKVAPVMLVTDGRKKVLQPSWLASHTMRALKAFCFSADPEPGPQHFPYVAGIDQRVNGERGMTNNLALCAELSGYLADAWADMQEIDGKLPFGHDTYLKIWQLGEPRIAGDFVLFDECQDASPVMLEALRWNALRGSQIVLVGDSQQMLYEWRGAVNAFAHMPMDMTTYLSQSFRFGPAIANVANVVLDRPESPLRLKGLPSIPSVVGVAPSPDVVPCRSNSAAVGVALNFMRAGRKPHLVGGAADVVRFAVAVGELQNTGETSHPELACFTSWAEVLAYVEQDPQGDELALMVSLVEEYGVAIIIDALDGMV